MPKSKADNALEKQLIEALEEAKKQGYGLAYVSGRIGADYPELDRALCVFMGRPDFVGLCGKVNNGYSCTAPAGTSCPDCGTACHDVPEGA